MTHVEEMLRTYPADLGDVDRAALVRCIEECVDCSQTCTACADACLSEAGVADLVKCVRTCSDCADICDTTGRVLSRHTGYDANLTRAMLQACVTACGSCADECEGHAQMHEHCRVCAQACRRCEQACQELISPSADADVNLLDDTGGPAGAIQPGLLIGSSVGVGV
jgi:Domain of Unknown Function (DUF326)